MAQVIGKINDLDGSFFIKDTEGNISAAKIGDTLNAGDVLLGSGSNNNNNFATVLLADNSKAINIIGNEQQLFDETMLTLELNSDTVVLDEELNESLLLESTNNIVEEETNNEQATLTVEEIENLDAAAAGDESPEDTEVLSARFEDRTALEIDVNTDLRDATNQDASVITDENDADFIEPIPIVSINAIKDVAYESSSFFYNIRSFFNDEEIKELTQENDTLEFEIIQDVLARTDSTVTLSLNLGEAEVEDINSIIYTNSSGNIVVLDTAELIQNFVENADQITIPAGSLSAPAITLFVANDSIYEISEELSFSISSPINSTIGTAIATGVILDDGEEQEGDKPTVNINATTDTAVEGESTGIVFTISQTNESNFDTSVDFTLNIDELENEDILSISYTDNTGATTLTDPADILNFINNGVTLTIGANTFDTPTVTIVPVDDDIYENEESFSGNIDLSSGETDAILGNASANAKIVDEGEEQEGDKPTVNITATIDEATEGLNDSVLFTISQTNESNFDTSVDFLLNMNELENKDIASITYTDSNGTTTISDPSDILNFVNNGVTLTIAANTFDTPTISLLPVDDNIYEIEENFSGSITLSVGEVDANLGVNTANAKILDNGEEQEGDKPTVNIVATIDTAKELGFNYEQQFDSIQEEAQQETVLFTISQTNESNFDTSVDFLLNMDELESEDIASITYQDSNGSTTITNPADILNFVNNGVTLTIAANTFDTPTIELTPYDDDIHEIQENFFGTISLSAGETDAILGISSDNARFLDEGRNNEGDKPTVSIAATDALVVEGVANDKVVFEISQDNVSNFETKVVAKLDLDEVELADIDTITYTDAGGTATVLTAGQITALTDGTGLEVLIPVGSSGKPSFTITAVDDDIYEQSEAFGMNISGEVNATLGTASDTAAIDDENMQEGDKPTVSIAATIDAATEGETTGVLFTISQTNLSNFDTSVDFTLDLNPDLELEDIASITYIDSNGSTTITSPTDITNFVNSGTTLTINANTSDTPTVKIVPFDDTIFNEGEEFFSGNIALSAGESDAILGTDTDDAKFIDNDVNDFPSIGDIKITIANEANNTTTLPDSIDTDYSADGGNTFSWLEGSSTLPEVYVNGDLVVFEFNDMTQQVLGKADGITYITINVTMDDNNGTDFEVIQGAEILGFPTTTTINALGVSGGNNSSIVLSFNATGNVLLADAVLTAIKNGSSSTVNTNSTAIGIQNNFMDSGEVLTMDFTGGTQNNEVSSLEVNLDQFGNGDTFTYKVTGSDNVVQSTVTIQYDNTPGASNPTTYLIESQNNTSIKSIDFEVTSGSVRLEISSIGVIESDNDFDMNLVYQIEDANGDTDTGNATIVFDGDQLISYDSTHTLIDGGAGDDTLILDALDGDIDFSALDNPEIKNIEKIDLSDGDHNLENLRLDDVMDMVDPSDKMLLITGDSSDSVELENGSGTWTTSTTQTIDSVTYDVYTNSEDSSYKVLIQTDVTDSVM